MQPTSYGKIRREVIQSDGTETQKSSSCFPTIIPSSWIRNRLRRASASQELQLSVGRKGSTSQKAEGRVGQSFVEKGGVETTHNQVELSPGFSKLAKKRGKGDDGMGPVLSAGVCMMMRCQPYNFDVTRTSGTSEPTGSLVKHSTAQHK